VAYSAGWKKLEPLWDLVIRAGWIGRFRPLLETVLAGRQAPCGARGERGEAPAALADL